MIHLGRWLICLGLLANSISFVTLLVFGFGTTAICLAISLVCYPLSILFIHLARNFINSKCCFYRNSDSTPGKILKTVFMPIVASGALIMFHLLTTTYRKMNEAVEDNTGFSPSSIFRTVVGLVIYFVCAMIVHLIIDGVFDNSIASDVSLGVLIFGGVAWLVSNILWDILDFAEKESNGFILFKNITFLAVGVLGVALGIFALIGKFSTEVSYGSMLGLFCMIAGHICIHFVYYVIIRAGKVPQSKLTYFWGLIAVSATLAYSLLVSILAMHGIAWIVVFFTLTVLAYVAVVFFLGVPFSSTDGEYRSVYREIAKQKRIAKMKKATSSSSSSSSYSTSSSSYSSQDAPVKSSDGVSDVYKISEAAHKVAGKYGYGTSVSISAISSINSIRLYKSSTSTEKIVYSLYCTLYLDLRLKKPTEAQFAAERAKEAFERELQKLRQKIINQTVQELERRNVSIPSIAIEIEPNIEEDIRY